MKISLPLLFSMLTGTPPILTAAYITPRGTGTPLQTLLGSNQKKIESLKDIAQSITCDEAVVAPPQWVQQPQGGVAREKILNGPALWEYNFGLQDPALTLPHGIEARVSAPEKFELTEEQIQTLEEDGVVHIKGVFDEEWVDYLRAASGHQVDNPHFWAL